MKICKWSILFGIGLTALTVFMILDTFVIPESELAVTEEDSRFAEITALQEENEALSETVNEPEAEETTETKEASKADETPESEEVSASPQITLATYRVNDTDIYVADIVFDSVESLKTAFAQDTYGRKITDKTSRIAENKNAVLAINGDYYGARERGYVIRNGV